MSSPMPVAPLVPRAKTTKKKKPGFRPVGKSKGVKFSKPSTKSAKASSTKDTSVSAAEQEKNNLVDEASTNGVVPSNLRSPTKKRKKSKSIAIGHGLSQSGEEPLRQATGSTKATSTSQESSSSNSETRSTRNTAIVVAAPLPAPALQDKDILERLVAENPNGVRLNSFCTSFKGPKRELPENQQAATPAPRAVTAPTKPPSESGGAPVVQIIDGEIVLQESSLMFPGQRRSVQEVEAEFDVVEEDTQLAIVGASYNSFVTRKGPQHWTVDETKRFFEALRQLGTDFCSMEAFFDNRTRKQLKRKYRSELTKHPTLIEMALDPKNQIEIDLSVFNVEVDPKAIEAAANDEPPVYEPTDVEPREKEGTDKIVGMNGSQDQWEEVVEEDADEEARAAAAESKASQLQSIWPTNEAEKEPHQHEQMDFPEPSMEDFFQEHEGDTPVPPSADEPPPEEEATAVSISLVPKKTNTKSKKPKFRSVSRKRK